MRMRRSKVAVLAWSLGCFDVVKAMAATCGDGLVGLRDRARLLLGFAGAFCWAEMVTLQVEYLSEDAGGLSLSIRRSKSDQAGEDHVVGIARTGTRHARSRPWPPGKVPPASRPARCCARSVEEPGLLGTLGQDFLHQDQAIWGVSFDDLARAEGGTLIFVALTRA